MLNVLNVNRPIIANGVKYSNSTAAYEALKNFKGEVNITILPKVTTVTQPAVNPVESNQTIKTDVAKIYRIEVRQYMTKKATPEFDFMDKYNDGKPMQMRVMFGEILEETKGMYRMKLHGRAQKDSVNCAHCMRKLTHPVSRIYGIGPVCGGHFWETNDWIDTMVANEEILFEEADKRLREIVWEGWIIKKAITSMNVVETKKEEVAI